MRVYGYLRVSSDKQDFTPAQVGLLTAMLTDNGTARQSIYEPTAGNGSMIIQKWWNQCLKKAPWDTYPNRMRVECWELSDRSIPILLLNLSIRGIVGIVHHGDVLEQKEKVRYELVNEKDDALGFSKVFRRI